ADVVVVNVQTEHISMLFGHGTFCKSSLRASSLRSCRVQGEQGSRCTSCSSMSHFCNVDERTAILTLLCRLTRVPIERQNLRQNIESARTNRIAISRVLGVGTEVGAWEVTGSSRWPNAIIS